MESDYILADLDYIDQLITSVGDEKAVSLVNTLHLVHSTDFLLEAEHFGASDFQVAYSYAKALHLLMATWEGRDNQLNNSLSVT